MLLSTSLFFRGKGRREEGDRNRSRGVLFAFLLDPSRCRLERCLAQKIDNGFRNGPLQLNITCIKHPGTFWLLRMVLQMPMSRNVVEITRLLVVQRPCDRVMLRRIRMIIKGSILRETMTQQDEPTTNLQQQRKHRDLSSTYRISWNHSNDHLCLDGASSISVLLNFVVLGFIHFGHLALVAVQAQNL